MHRANSVNANHPGGITRQCTTLHVLLRCVPSLTRQPLTVPLTEAHDRTVLHVVVRTRLQYHLVHRSVPTP